MVRECEVSMEYEVIEIDNLLLEIEAEKLAIRDSCLMYGDEENIFSEIWERL